MLYRLENGDMVPLDEILSGADIVKKRGKGKKNYINLFAAFDIEVTNYAPAECGIMYIWQFQLGQHNTIIGRTWDQFKKFIDELDNALPGQLIIYVHNLGYEFSWLKSVLDFKPDEVFSVKPRKVLKASYRDHIEFRCSYMLTNMSLRKFLENMKVSHLKTDLDYNKIRFPWTELSPEELEYCINDVRGLVEAVTKKAEADGDTPATIPLTSTGYIRREFKRAMYAGYSMRKIQKMQPDERLYKALKEAFRGGDTHANRAYTGKILENVKSMDRSSSYPEIISNSKVPMGPLQHLGVITPEKFRQEIKRGRALLMRVAFYDLKEKHPDWGAPYLSIHKCRAMTFKQGEGIAEYCQVSVNDNGRLLRADYVETTITDVDLRIIADVYTFAGMYIFDAWSARYDYLPRPMRDLTNEYYRRKTELKGIKETADGQDAEYLYGKVKALLNSIYGCCATDPCKDSLLFFRPCDFIKAAGLDFGMFIDEWQPEGKSIETLLEENRNHAFLAFQWSCWITAWARYRLHEGRRAAGPNAVYWDTDSVKYIGDVDMDKWNAARMRDSEKNGACAADPGGSVHYMGVFEYEGQYKKYITLGAKKYAWDGIIYPDGTEKKGIGITVAGVSKKAGAKQLKRLEDFKEGFIFTGNAAGLEAKYNDNFDKVLEIDGHKIRVQSNLYLSESTYEIGLAASYKRIIENWQIVEL